MKIIIDRANKYKIDLNMDKEPEDSMRDKSKKNNSIVNSNNLSNISDLKSINEKNSIDNKSKKSK